MVRMTSWLPLNLSIRLHSSLRVQGDPTKRIGSPPPENTKVAAPSENATRVPPFGDRATLCIIRNTMAN